MGNIEVEDNQKNNNNMKKLTLFLIANSKINQRFRKGEDFIMGCAGLGSSALPQL